MSKNKHTGTPQIATAADGETKVLGDVQPDPAAPDVEDLPEGDGNLPEVKVSIDGEEVAGGTLETDEASIPVALLEQFEGVTPATLNPPDQYTGVVGLEDGVVYRRSADGLFRVHPMHLPALMLQGFTVPPEA